MTTPLPVPLTLDDWAELPECEHARLELVRGYVTMSPHEAYVNRSAGAHVLVTLFNALGREYLPVTDLDVILSEAPATVRCPDVVVVARERMRGRKWALARDVDLVVEVVSPSSVADDWVIKRDEYAAAGVPAYLVIDLRGDTPRLALFDRLVGGRYADPVGDGRRVDLHIAGRTIPLDVDDLVR